MNANIAAVQINIFINAAIRESRSRLNLLFFLNIFITSKLYMQPMKNMRRQL